MIDGLKRLSGPAKLATISAASCVIGIGFCGVGFSFDGHSLLQILGDIGVICFWLGLLGILIAFAWGVIAEIYKSWRKNK